MKILYQEMYHFSQDGLYQIFLVLMEVIILSVAKRSGRMPPTQGTHAISSDHPCFSCRCEIYMHLLRIPCAPLKKS